MMMFAYVPALLELGVPESCPVAELNEAHVGRFAIENVNASPFASEALGLKLYALPLAIDLSGVPEMTGAAFAADFTVRVKAGSEDVSLPSLALMMMLLYVAALVGVPDSLPVVVLNVAQLGLFCTLNPSVSPLASVALG
jgi:hypothetical protein